MVEGILSKKVTGMPVTHVAISTFIHFLFELLKTKHPTIKKLWGAGQYFERY